MSSEKNRAKHTGNLSVVLLVSIGWLMLQLLATLISTGNGRPQNSIAIPRASPTNSAPKTGLAFPELPLSFEANEGQADDRVKFISHGIGQSLLLTTSEALLTLNETSNFELGLEASILRMKLNGANRTPRVIGIGELPSRSNYFVGRDPNKWRRNVPTYSRVKYEQVYPGVDLIYYGNQRQLEYDFRVAPGASYRAIAIQFEGVHIGRLDDEGDLVLETPTREIRQHRPVVYQELNGVRQKIAAHYALKDREVSFEIGAYDASRELVIDPILSYSTFLGGTGIDEANAIAVDSDGNVYVTGSTVSSDFPTENALQGKPGSRFSVYDVFVAKLNNAGTALVYSTYLGGEGEDKGYGIAVDASGNAYVTGGAHTGFPTTPGTFQTDAADRSSDAFVAKLSPSGNELIYSTFLGGKISPTLFSFFSGDDIGKGIAVDSTGNAYIAGTTYSPSFPTKRALQPIFNRAQHAQSPAGPPPPLINLFPDAFVAKLNLSGTDLVYSTYLGGSYYDEGHSIAVDSSGNAYVTGYTSSTDFPTANAVQATYGGGVKDAFLAKLDLSGKSFVYSTFLGGARDDEAYSVATDASGNAYVTGETTSADFPITSKALQSVIGGAPIFKSTDGGNSWNTLRLDLPPDSFSSLAIDPVTPTTLYAIFNDYPKQIGTFKSTDGGGHWESLKDGAPTFSMPYITSLTIDPKTPSTIYATASGKIFKSTNGGATWRDLLFTKSNAVGVTVDPTTPTTLYVGTFICPPAPIPGGASNWTLSDNDTTISRSALSTSIQPNDATDYHPLFKSTDSGITWKETGLGDNCAVGPVLIDSKNSSTLYANSFKSTDGGDTWSGLNRFVKMLAIDPSTPSTIYADYADRPDYGQRLIKSTNGGLTWSDIALIGLQATAVAIDPLTPSTIYAVTNILVLGDDYFRNGAPIGSGFGGGIFKSTDGGATWSGAKLAGATIKTVVIDPLSPSTLYAGTFQDSDAFVTKINVNGSALVYSTFLGGSGRDAGFGIAVDSAGRAYVTGQTFSGGYPIKDATQPNKASDVFATGAFVAELDPTGSDLAFSTHLGGSGNTTDSGDAGLGIAVDRFDKVYVAGRTASKDFPNKNSIQRAYAGGRDAFISKIAFVPRISSVRIAGKNLIVNGEHFDRGAVILLNGEQQKTANDESSPSTLLIAKKAGRKVTAGQPVTIQVRNGDNSLSDEFTFTRTAQ